MVVKTISKNYGAFCEETSIHGFAEFYRAKFVFWKIIWFGIIFAALSTTGYQVYQSVYQYLHQVQNVNVKHLDTVWYPPVKVCRPHWWLWLDLDKIKQNLPEDLDYQDTVSLIVSYITNITVNNPINVDHAESKFSAFLNEKQLTLEKFLLNNTLERQNDSLWNKSFTQTELAYVENSLALCFVCDWSKVATNVGAVRLNFFPNYENKVYKSDFGLWSLHSTQQLWAICNDWFIARKFRIYPDPRSQKVCNNFTLGEMSPKQLFSYMTKQKYKLPDFISFDGMNGINLYLEHLDIPFLYNVDLRPSVQFLLHSYNDQCIEGQRTMYTQLFCNKTCQLASSFKENEIMDYDDTNNATKTYCKTLGTIVTAKENSTRLNEICKNVISSDDYNFSLSSVVTSNSTLYNKCIKQCGNGCEKWVWSVSVSRLEAFPNENLNGWYFSSPVNINYPTADQILAFEEVGSKTWEDFVGNVGGLLGIWTGASIVSLLQAVYLFCFAPEKNAINALEVKQIKVKPTLYW